MKQILAIAVVVFSLSSCSKNLGNTQPFVIERDNLKLEAQLKSGLLHDTLSYYKDNSLYIKQLWENGILLATIYNDAGLRILDTALFEIYDSIKIITDTNFVAGKPTTFQVLNVPANQFAIVVNGGIAKLNGDSFNITPDRQKGDTLKIKFWYIVYESDFENYIIQ